MSSDRLDEFLDSFVVYIISYKRPHNIKTLRLLEELGYTGRTFIVVDDKDETLPEYLKLYGDMVKIYSKAEIAQRYDRMDNFGEETWKSAWFPRNAVNEMAISDGLKYFCVLDDDYYSLERRFINDEDECFYVTATPPITKENTTNRFFDKLVYTLTQIFDLHPNIVGVGVAQSGDFVLGRSSKRAKEFTWWRKLMNFFIFSSDRIVDFVGRMNEDVNTYVYHSLRGKVFFTVPITSIHQMPTQLNPGGCSGLYLQQGTYIKSFYSVMAHPAGVKVSAMHTDDPRIHHKVTWNYTAPKIISERFRKVQKMAKRGI